MKHSQTAGFTLVEILIVVVILGILAMIVIPKYASANTEAKEATVAADLQSIQRQIDRYKVDHSGRGPELTPTGVQDNLKGFDMAKDLTAVDMMTSTDSLSYATTTQATWQSVWPGASDYTTAVPASTTGKNHLHMNVWVWIKDESVAAHRSSKIYSITLIYTWAYADGGRIRYVTDTVRSLRSAVATN